MNLYDLWIGDTVRLKSSGKIGTFIGLTDKGKARVRCGVKVILSKENNVELYNQEKKELQPLELIELPRDHIVPSLDSSKELDLHIETLNPTLQNEVPQMILSHQIAKCREFVERAIQRRLNSVVIIHGRGTGQLKLEVDHLLSQYDEFNYAIPIHRGGASEVWFKY